MTRAEEAALKAYPKEGGTCLTAFGRFDYDKNVPFREGFINGYKQALEDVRKEVERRISWHEAHNNNEWIPSYRGIITFIDDLTK